VKGNLELLLALAPLAAEAPQLRLVFCGPSLDPAYCERFRSALAGHPWAAWAGPQPVEAMAAALRQADVILNHSASEGLPNALLEAAALGRPILARDIPGNAAVVEHGVNGLLYGDEDELLRSARTLLEPAERQRLCRPTPGLYDPAQESAALLAIYSQALAGKI
ncbi:MAG: glycosyltransferase, partial [Desulfuromonadales bacterium]|nr:glycosyltransferase [Desulfuromonadales bacterium]